MNITSIRSWWALDSRGNPTIAVAVSDSLGNTARAYVPSGASTGTHEALELRDGGIAFKGKGVTKAVANINETISPALTNIERTLEESEAVLLSLDSTDNKSALGANAILGVSMALHRLAAMQEKKLLADSLYDHYFKFPKITPRLMCNVINGGAHSDAGLAIQEFMVVPKTGSLQTDVQAASEIYHSLKKILSNKGMITAVGDEGGFAPHIKTTREVLDIVSLAIAEAGYIGHCDLALDCAASEFYDKETNRYTVDGISMTQSELVAFYEKLVSEYPIISIEDGFAEDDLRGWKLMTENLGSKIKLVGDDLFVTNNKRIQDIGVNQGIANSLLVKLNQIGSVSETVAAIKLAQGHNMTTIISHRSGETEDSFIADLTLASSSEFIKLGAPARTDRTVKYNRLLELSLTK
jgi:enolase